MVDFRYHLVSLISVFFALAIGIILGAGPLQNSIGNVLQSQVSDLRTTNENLKNANAELEQTLDQHEQALADIAPTLIEGTLTGQRVAIVVLPGVPDAQVGGVREYLEQAGASVAGQAVVTDTWTRASETSFRTTFADQIRTYVPEIDDAAEANHVLALALNVIVRDGASDYETLVGLMTGTDTPMLAVDGMADGSDAVVVLVPDVESPPSPDADAQAQQNYTTTTFTDLVAQLAERGPTVVAGAANSEDDVVRAVRDGAVEVSTVDSIDLELGLINIPIATATELTDGLIHLGLDAGAEQVLGSRMEAPSVAAADAEHTGDAETSGDAEPSADAAESAPAGEAGQDGAEQDAGATS